MHLLQIGKRIILKNFFLKKKVMTTAHFGQKWAKMTCFSKHLKNAISKE